MPPAEIDSLSELALSRQVKMATLTSLQSVAANEGSDEPNNNEIFSPMGNPVEVSKLDVEIGNVFIMQYN